MGVDESREQKASMSIDNLVSSGSICADESPPMITVAGSHMRRPSNILTLVMAIFLLFADSKDRCCCCMMVSEYVVLLLTAIAIRCVWSDVKLSISVWKLEIE